MWARGRRSGITIAERDPARRERFIALHGRGSHLRYLTISLLVTASVAVLLGLVTNWSLALTCFVLWMGIDLVSRWWAVNEARHAAATAAAVNRPGSTTADG
jgi:hypothetical protein